MSTRDAARWWITQYKFWTLPVNWKEKGATVKDWPNLRLTLDMIDLYFNGEPQNISILMGDPENLTDIDIDCGEARWAAIEYLPSTGLKWGRRSNPGSHHLYFTDPGAATAKYLDPVAEKENPGEACLIELRCRTKEGKLGFPVVAPPSVHPSGEPYEFVGSPGQPAKVAGPWLGERTRLIAAASMLGRHARQGLCHETFIALAGVMARAKWDLEEAQRFVRAIYRVLWKESANVSQANADVDSTYKTFKADGETTGLTRLGELVDERVFKRLKEWLGFEWQDGAARAQPPPRKAPRVLPESEDIDVLLARDIVMPQWLIEDFLRIPSIGLLVSPPKTGKTVLAVEIAMSIANQLNLFNNYQTRQGGAALIVEWDDQQAESSLKEFRQKCRACANGLKHKLDFITRPKDLPDFTISDPEFRGWLAAQIQKHGAKVAVLDSLTALRGFASDDKTRNVVKLEANEVTMLGEIAIQCQCAILLVHHESKTAAPLDTFSRAAGTYALQACSDSQMVISRFRDLPPDDSARLMSVRGRHLRDIEAVLKFREESLDFDYLIDGAGARWYPELRQLLSALRGKSFDAKQAGEETGWQKTKVYNVLHQLTRANILIKHDKAWGWNDSESMRKTLEQI